MIFYFLGLPLILYFGFPISIKIIWFLVFTRSFAVKFLPKTEASLSFFISLIILVFTYGIIGLLSTPKFSLLTLLIVSLFIINKKTISSRFSINLNFFDLVIIVLCFVISSQPQLHWDATMANLYNAKWYVQNNSFKPIPESISSLFPQNSIIYYSLFYHLGQYKGLHLAIILPLVFFIQIIKTLHRQLCLPTQNLIAAYLLIISPMVIFQSSNGYYDLLLLDVCLAAICFLVCHPQNILLPSFLFGFAAGIKYFPIIFLFLPILLKPQKGLLVLISSSIPFIPWLIRTFQSTGNPFFPFAQYFFPTPDLWSPSDILENNPMIKTTMSFIDWIRGGFILYPLKTYLHTENFLEAYPHFPTITPIVLLPLSLFLFLKPKKNISLVFRFSFLAFLLIGLLTRYYRYLWPFQLITGLLTIFQISFPKNIFFRYLISFTVFFLFVSNLRFLYRYFQYYPVNRKYLFNPEYYFTHSDSTHPINFLNSITQNNPMVTILDASKYSLSRLNFSGRVYQCSWYWVGISQPTQFQQKFPDSFDYLITGNPPESAQNVCSPYISQNIEKYPVIFKNDLYRIYQLRSKNAF